MIQNVAPIWCQVFFYVGWWCCSHVCSFRWSLQRERGFNRNTTCIWYVEEWELKLSFYPSAGGFKKMKKKKSLGVWPGFTTWLKMRRDGRKWVQDRILPAPYCQYPRERYDRLCYTYHPVSLANQKMPVIYQYFLYARGSFFCFSIIHFCTTVPKYKGDLDMRLNHSSIFFFFLKRFFASFLGSSRGAVRTVFLSIAHRTTIHSSTRKRGTRSSKSNILHMMALHRGLS